MKKLLSRVSIQILFSFIIVLSISSCDFDEVKNDFVTIFTREVSIDQNRSLSLTQLENYKRLTSALITLDEKFIEELDKASSDDRQEILNTMGQARDKLVKKFDFKNYEEYLWIDSVAIHDPANQALLKTANIDLVEIK